jgi:O-6-methylguanine DNA methyltransferase
MKIFTQRVLDVVRRIPKGQTMTYKEVAKAAGRPKAYRAVGNILNKNDDPAIPCHRVIRSDGTFGGYNRGAELKKQRLQNEQGAKRHLRPYDNVTSLNPSLSL